MSSLFRKFIVLLALSVAVSGTAVAKAKDESDGKTSKLKSGLFSKKTTKKKSTAKKPSKSITKKIKAKKSTTRKTGGKKAATSAGKEQYKNITVNINRASASALSAYLVSIGPARATAIEKYRKANGKFKSIDGLLKVDGIGENVLADIKKNISLSRGETSAPEGYKMGEVGKSTSKKSTRKKTGSRSTSRGSKKSTDSASTRNEKKGDSTSSSSGDKKTTRKKTGSKKSASTAKKSSDKMSSTKSKKKTKAKKPSKKAKASSSKSKKSKTTSKK